MSDKPLKNCLNCKHFFPLTGKACPETQENGCLGTKEPYYYLLWEKRELKPYHAIAESVADLVVEKQAAYGDSFGCASYFLKILYPTGVPVEKYDDMLTLVRIFDKIKRIATDKNALGESPYRDILGYCLLALNQEGGDK